VKFLYCLLYGEGNQAGRESGNETQTGEELGLACG
jgi:hypothetical protein